VAIADAVVTGVTVAVTGTVILDGGPGQGRRALILLPGHHVCVVRASRIVEDVPAALARPDPVRSLVLISGPSATRDIEPDRVEGVHGPRVLDVVVIDD
jgi:L-lactate dehydrogenase complex protein LldG